MGSACLSAIHSSGFFGAVLPETCGYGHSFGKAWCIHWAKRRPWSGTLPPLRVATSSSLPSSEAVRFRGASTEEEEICETAPAICEAGADGAATSRSSYP